MTEVLTIENDEVVPNRDEMHDIAVRTLGLQERDDSPLYIPTFSQTIDLMIHHKREKKRFFLEVMEEGLHYGVIPGTGTKPTLFKAGAEMLLANMGLNAGCFDAEPQIFDLTGKVYGEPFIRYRRQCRVYKQFGRTIQERMIVAEAGGSCNSWEVKYRWRNESMKCPKCERDTIIKGKAEYGGGWLCWGKKGGCGAKFSADDKAITGQIVGKIVNPDIADTDNTLLKMADKRALVASTLIATGCSDIFTQDVEDLPQFADPNEALDLHEKYADPKPAESPGPDKPPRKSRAKVDVPTPAVPKVATDAAQKSSVDKERNAWVGQLTALEDRAALTPPERAERIKMYGVGAKREMTPGQMKNYGTWLNRLVDVRTTERAMLLLKGMRTHALMERYQTPNILALSTAQLEDYIGWLAEAKTAMEEYYAQISDPDVRAAQQADAQAAYDAENP